jgi:DTW domain-containing protein YfiP
MSRSVVLEGAPRCDRCSFPHRWCICAGFQPLACPLQIDVLIHHREFWRPTSTGRLINRIIPSSRVHKFHCETPPARESIVQPGRPVWILHPRGEPLPTGTPPPDVQVLLLDGSWKEAARMLQAVEGWGQRIRLPMTGPSRYWLRGHQGEGMYSTVEALLFLLAAAGMSEAETHLRLQFELHVYAGLRARGAKAAAAEYLADSPVRAAFPELVQQLDQRRPRT